MPNLLIEGIDDEAMRWLEVHAIRTNKTIERVIVECIYESSGRPAPVGAESKVEFLRPGEAENYRNHPDTLR
jgi:hypothetical protein